MGPGRLSLAAGIFGLVLYAATGVLYTASGLMVPPPWLYLLWAIWVVGIAGLIRVFRNRPVLTPLVAVGAAVLWFVVLTLGERFLGWTA